MGLQTARILGTVLEHDAEDLSRQWQEMLCHMLNGSHQRRNSCSSAGNGAPRIPRPWPKEPRPVRFPCLEDADLTVLSAPASKKVHRSTLARPVSLLQLSQCLSPALSSQAAQRILLSHLESETWQIVIKRRSDKKQSLFGKCWRYASCRRGECAYGAS